MGLQGGGAAEAEGGGDGGGLQRAPEEGIPGIAALVRALQVRPGKKGTLSPSLPMGVWVLLLPWLLSFSGGLLRPG